MLRRYEPEITRFLRTQLRDAHVFFDIGAAAGRYSRLGMRVMKQGTVVAFEPNPEVRGRLERLNIDVMPFALGATDGTVNLELRRGECARIEQNRAHTAVVTEARVLSVPVRRLDSLQLPRPDVIKIDLEGAELDVLAGGMVTVARASALVVECHSMPLLRDVLTLLLDHGFGRVSVTRGGDYVGPPALLAVR
jgi:FkbM family methyltransferase